MAGQAPPGVPAAVEGAGSIAAPLLAGFSFTLVVLLVPGSSNVRWPEFALLFFLLAGLTLIGTVQSLLWSRQYAGTGRQARWDTTGRITYNVGIFLLLSGVTVLLIPPGDVSLIRHVIVAFAGAATVLEGCWVIRSYTSRPAHEQLQTQKKWQRAVDWSQPEADIRLVMEAYKSKGRDVKAALKDARKLGHGVRSADLPGIFGSEQIAPAS